MLVSCHIFKKTNNNRNNQIKGMKKLFNGFDSITLKLVQSPSYLLENEANLLLYSSSSIVLLENVNIVKNMSLHVFCKQIYLV